MNTGESMDPVATAKRLVLIDRVLLGIGIAGSLVPFSVALYLVWQKVGVFDSDLSYVGYGAAVMVVALLVQHVTFKVCLALRDRLRVKYIHE